MGIITKDELQKILENHSHWFREDCVGWESMRANLCGANLREANLREANLREANLYRADLCGANLREANLREANLYRADLCGANLCGADLYRADLREADLYRANLREANLCGANLCGANLYRADLREADLCGANLCEANLCEANLCGATNIPFIPMVCPDSGSFIGWKKARLSRGEHPDYCIVMLEIPSDAKRSSATGRKCRCDKAVVKSIASLDNSVVYDHAYSDYDIDFVYEVGKTVSVDNFDEDRFNECSTGIHFFINRQEAVDYLC